MSSFNSEVRNLRNRSNELQNSDIKSEDLLVPPYATASYWITDYFQ